MTATPHRSFEEALRREVRGQVAFDAVHRGLYATDASYYQIWPVGLVVPLDDDDVRAAVRLARAHGVSVLARGGGTSLAGQAVGRSLVIDFSAHMNRVLELDPAGRWVRVQPGIVRDVLNVFLRPHGLHFSPDPATANRANVGGMIANNSSGARSLLYGKTVDHVRALRVLLADGTEHLFGPLAPDAWAEKLAAPGREGELYRGVHEIITANREEIAARFPKVMRRVGGYNLDLFPNGEAWSLAKLVTGSEGTLGVLLEATLDLDPLPAAKALVIVHYRELLASIADVPEILRHGPSAVELLDGNLLRLALEHPVISRQCDFLEGRPEAILVVEFYGTSPEDVAARARAFADSVLARGVASAARVATGAADQARVWAVRRAGLGLMARTRGKRKPISFIEDAAVPVEHLAEYVAGVIELCRRKGVRVTMYAHASVGVLHLKPVLDLKDPADVRLMTEISSEALELVMSYGGSWSGEHGDGLARSAHLERFFGSRVYGLFREVKTLFDPDHLLNPGKIIDAPAADRDFRYAPPYPAEVDVATAFHYRAEGGFGHAVELCNGTGACRKLHEGTMCPSYMATRDEMHSTRGRANALRLAMTGQLGGAGLCDERLAEVLDLCLACKACKAECPSGVDMARLKSEVQHALHERHGSAFRDRMLARSTELGRAIAGPLAPIANAVQGFAPVHGLAARALRLDRRRSLPRYAAEPLSRWFGRARGNGAVQGTVALFADCYVEAYEPEVGKKAVTILRELGFAVELAAPGCCQRPRISKGFLNEARSRAARTVQGLVPFLERGVPIVVCEPSCASAFCDDLPDLLEDAELGERLAAGVVPIEAFLAEQAPNAPASLAPIARKIRIHGHCHQKALFGTSAMTSFLSRWPGVEVGEVDAGCCGMAGAFGYEAEHYALSMAVGEDRLFPALRAMDDETLIVACGFSCRHQIADAVGRRAVHFVDAFGPVPPTHQSP